MFIAMEKLGNLEFNGLEFLGLHVQRQLSKSSLCTECNVSIPRKKGIHKIQGSIETFGLPSTWYTAEQSLK